MHELTKGSKTTLSTTAHLVEIASGTFGAGESRIETRVDRPSMVYVEVTSSEPDSKPFALGAVDLEALFGVGERRDKTRVVKHRRQVEQFGVRFHAEPLGMDLAEVEHPAGVVVDERRDGLLDETRRFGDCRSIRNLDPGNGV